MNIMKLIERFIPERQNVDTIAKRLYTDLQRLPADPFASDDIIEVARQIAGRPTGHDTEQLRNAIAAMTERQRAAISLHVKYDYTFKEVAEALSITDALALREIRTAYAAIRRTFV